MKVVCVDNDGGKKSLTLGKSYDVISESGSYYYIEDDGGDGGWFKYRFRSISDIREKKLDIILE